VNAYGWGLLTGVLIGIAAVCGLVAAHFAGLGEPDPSEEDR
jgi:hypothetical protein